MYNSKCKQGKVNDMRTKFARVIIYANLFPVENSDPRVILNVAINNMHQLTH